MEVQQMKLFPFRRKSADSNEETQESQPTIASDVSMDDATPKAGPESGPAAVPSADLTAEATAPPEAPEDPLAALPTPNSESEPALPTAPEPDVGVAAADAPALEAETSETAGDAPAPAKRAGAPDDLLAQMSAEADTEIAQEEAALAGGQKSDDDELDPELLDIFRDAKTEVQEGSLASELEDISAQELLAEATTIKQRLGPPTKRSATDPGAPVTDASSSDESNSPPDGEEQPTPPSIG
jgi:hypothetical protein